MSSVNDLPYKLTLKFVANPHTAVAENALRHIDVNVWVRIIEQFGVMATIEVCFTQAILQRKTMKIFTRKPTKCVRRMVPGKHAQQHRAFMLESRTVCPNHHSVSKKSIA
jgi:hypothetical protein